MIEISLEYLHKIAEQIIVICSLLAGFSIAVVANFLISETKGRLLNRIMVFATTAACLFLITLFSMTNIIMRTTEGYPFGVSLEDLLFAKIVGLVSFILGIISLITMISLSGWTKSKKMRIFTTVFGIISLLYILSLLTNSG